MPAIITDTFDYNDIVRVLDLERPESAVPGFSEVVRKNLQFFVFIELILPSILAIASTIDSSRRLAYTCSVIR